MQNARRIDGPHVARALGQILSVTKKVASMPWFKSGEEGQIGAIVVVSFDNGDSAYGVRFGLARPVALRIGFHDSWD